MFRVKYQDEICTVVRINEIPLSIIKGAPSFSIAKSYNTKEWIGATLLENCSPIEGEDYSIITNSIEWKEKKYTQLCRILDRFRDKNNPCGIKCENGKVTCKWHSRFDSSRTKSLCCGDCDYSSKKGCTTKNLLCKRFYCHFIIKPNKKLGNLVDTIATYSDKYFLYIGSCYISFEEFFIVEKRLAILCQEWLSNAKSVKEN